VDQQGPACHTGAGSCFEAGGLLTGGDPNQPVAVENQPVAVENQPVAADLPENG
jgi:hypothetical protein